MEQNMKKRVCGTALVLIAVLAVLLGCRLLLSPHGCHIFSKTSQSERWVKIPFI